jgi:hypothetical protein
MQYLASNSPLYVFLSIGGTNTLCPPIYRRDIPVPLLLGFIFGGSSLRRAWKDPAIGWEDRLDILVPLSIRRAPTDRRDIPVPHF